MVELSDDSLQFLDDMWNKIRKTLPDSGLEIFDSLRVDVFEKMAAGFRGAVERKGAWLKNDMSMVFVDLVSQKMHETKDKLAVAQLENVRNVVVKRVLKNLMVP